jgi:hypothetical protein
MLSQIYELPVGSAIPPEYETYLRSRLKKLTRYKNLEPHIDRFTMGSYNGFKMILMWKDGKPKGIPLPKGQLMSNKSVRTRVITRLRKVIEDQIRPRRIRGLHVDHVYPFSAMVDDWLKINRLTYSQVRSKHYPSFYEYHLQNAVFQYLTPKENIAKGDKIGV